MNCAHKILNCGHETCAQNINFCGCDIEMSISWAQISILCARFIHIVAIIRFFCPMSCIGLRNKRTCDCFLTNFFFFAPSYVRWVGGCLPSRKNTLSLLVAVNVAKPPPHPCPSSKSAARGQTAASLTSALAPSHVRHSLSHSSDSCAAFQLSPFFFDTS